MSVQDNFWTIVNESSSSNGLGKECKTNSNDQWLPVDKKHVSPFLCFSHLITSIELSFKLKFSELSLSILIT